MIWSVAYILSVLGVNLGFSHWPELDWLWSIAVGSIFVTRDFTQRAVGHWVFAPMAVGLVLSYALADPFVALASTVAFAISESTDWLVYTVTKRPLADRVLWSCAASAPLDSAVFLGMIGAFGWAAFGLQVASKMVAALVVWGGFRGRCLAGHRWTRVPVNGDWGWAAKCSRCGAICCRHPTLMSWSCCMTICRRWALRLYAPRLKPN